jgi:hypothetical protein
MQKVVAIIVRKPFAEANSATRRDLIRPEEYSLNPVILIPFTEERTDDVLPVRLCKTLTSETRRSRLTNSLFQRFHPKTLAGHGKLVDTHSGHEAN